MRGQVVYEQGTGGRVRVLNGEVLEEDPKAVVVITELATYQISRRFVIAITEAHPTNEEDDQ